MGARRADRRAGRELSALPGDSAADRLAGSWEANAGAWTRAVREGRIESRRVATDAAILGAILDRAPRRVLDVGCGEGWLGRALAERGVVAVGVDGSASLVDAARSAGDGAFLHLSYEQLALAPERVGGSPFDVAVCNFALLGEEIGPLLRSLRALMKPAGAIVIQTVHPWSARGDRYADGWRIEEFAGFGDAFAEPMPWYFRTLGSWATALRGAGLAIDELREAVHPHSGDPLSLLIVATSRAGDP